MIQFPRIDLVFSGQQGLPKLMQSLPRFAFCCHSILCFAVLGAGLARPTTAQVPFLETHCLRCHGSQTQKADRRFDHLSDKIATIDQLESWQEVVDQLNLQSMPPEGEPQPSDSDRASAIANITQAIAGASSRLRDAGEHTVLRRLNVWEYRQTIGDLLGLNVETWDPAAEFPPDETVDGFDNNGAELVMSGMLLDHYLIAAEEAVRRSTHFGPKPTTKVYTQKSPFYFSSKKGRYEGLPKLFHVDRFRFVPETPFTDLYGRHYRGGHIGFLPLAAREGDSGGVPHSGRYTVRVRAAAVSRTHNYGRALADFRNGDPLVLGLMAVNRIGSVESTGSVSDEHVLATVELTDEQPRWFQWDVYLEKGYEPEVRFLNGTQATKRLVRLLLGSADEHEEFQPFTELKAGTERSHGVLKAYRGPRLRIWEIEVSGPHVDHWPPTGHQRLYGHLRPDQLTATEIDRRLRSFAALAFRRPPQESELSPILSLVGSKLEQGMKPLAALQLGFQTILCAPAFLYFNESEGRLDSYALASRLSYFLWSSMPDAELREHADANRLNNTDVLRGQVLRMLSDPKSDRFVQHFIRRWLDLDNIGRMPPSTDFTSWYRDNLDSAMRMETESFFRHVLKQNLSPDEFLTADYSFLNRELALHYGIENVDGSHFRRVALDRGTRGGILGHGSFLTASANGVDTSPVVRGIYVAEKLLGYTPPPPPPDVPEIEPDVRDATTIRQQLAKHREIQTCAECHRKIDPLGFALENFDAIGAWRSEYGRKLPIDASGRFPGGDTFGSVSEFRQQLIDRTEQFTRCLTRKLMTYALGRKLNANDLVAVDGIVERVDADNGGLRDLLYRIVMSEPFQRN